VAAPKGLAMTRGTSDQLEQLLDRQAIWDCLLRYARGVDRLDEDLIRSAFWPDAHDAHGQINGSPENFVSTWMPTQPARQVGQHFVSNQSVVFDDKAGADAETYFMSAGKKFGSDTLELVGGRYVDRFEKREGEWRIKTRLVLLDWQVVADASGMEQRLSRGYNGSRDRSDPSYERPLRPRLAVPSAR
jgi:SnoaL-like domain